jgi:translation elongation factor EF-4
MFQGRFYLHHERFKHFEKMSRVGSMGETIRRKMKLLDNQKKGKKKMKERGKGKYSPRRFLER